MDEKKTSLQKEVEEALACSAFAEEGEPCPIDSGAQTSSVSPTTTKKTKPALESVETTMACSAFAEAGEPCPIDSGKKRKRN